MAWAPADIAVVGGGVIGLSVAVELARRRAGRIVLIDHGERCGEASRAAAGLLPIASSRSVSGPGLLLARDSLARYPAFLDGVVISGRRLDPPARIGLLRLPADAADWDRLQGVAAHRAAGDFRAELLSADAVRGMVPGIAEGVAGGLWCPDEAVIDRDALLGALTRAVDQLGVQCLRGVAVTKLSADATRVSVLEIGDTRLAVGAVVVAAGWWSAELVQGLGARLPVRPARGEMLALRAAMPVPFVLARGEAVLIPRGESTWVGSTSTYAADPQPSSSGATQLRAGAHSILPSLATSAVTAHWAGVRPCSTVGHPIIDRVPGLENVIVAAGHHRNGFLLAPLTAAVVAALLLAEAPPVPPALLGWRRLNRSRSGEPPDGRSTAN